MRALLLGRRARWHRVRARCVGGFAALLFMAPAVAQASDAIVERSVSHVVARGDSLGSLGARFGVQVARIAADNGLDPRKPLRVGQRVELVSRHVVPPPIEDGIVINIPQRMLFRFRGGRVASADPVSVGRRDWPTPTGEFTVLSRQVDKTWIVPPSIQEEMRREGKPVLTQVAPGPENPLGRHWIGLSLPGIGIHGTNAPASVYGFRSHGCIRMHPDDVAALFSSVRVGDVGRIVYRPLLMARGEDGRIWFEANPDAYRRGPGSLDTVKEMARLQSIAEESIDWAQVNEALRRREGYAQDVSRVATTDESLQGGASNDGTGDAQAIAARERGRDSRRSRYAGRARDLGRRRSGFLGRGIVGRSRPARVPEHAHRRVGGRRLS